VTTLNAIRAARETIGTRLHRTPIVGSATLSRMAGCPVWLKLENFQKTGSFKPRGAFNNIMSLDPAARARGVITISAGNHAQGVAWAASQVGIPSVVVMPAAASPAKAEAARGYGARVVLHGDIAAAFARLEELRAETGMSYVHAFDDEATIAGQGTVGLEIVEDLPDVERVIVGIGGGGLISGVAVAVKECLPAVRIVGVEPTGADAMTRSRAKGSPVRLERIDTIADGLAAPFAGERTFAIVQKYVDDLVLVSDDEIRGAMRLLLERCKVLAEPAGAAATAALLAGKAGGGVSTLVIVSGGNVAPGVLAALLSGPGPGRSSPASR
jgi:threonine dehydratase